MARLTAVRRVKINAVAGTSPLMPQSHHVHSGGHTLVEVVSGQLHTKLFQNAVCIQAPPKYAVTFGASPSSESRRHKPASSCRAPSFSGNAKENSALTFPGSVRSDTVLQFNAQ